MLFRGYVKTEGKEAIEKFKNVPDEKLRSLESARRLDSYAGIIKPGIMMLDLDDGHESDILYDILMDQGVKTVIYQTNRGKHFYFQNLNQKVKKATVHAFLPIGLLADVKLGEKNGYDALKVDGRERKIIFDNTDGNPPDEIPKWLVPLTKGQNKVSFAKLCEGDGRNSTLLTHQITLANNGFTMEEGHFVEKLINDFVFDEPLPDSEFKVVTRSEAWPSGRGSGGSQKFPFDEFALELIRDCYIIKINGQLHIYQNGKYIWDHKAIEGAMIRKEPKLSAHQRSEVLKYIDISIQKNRVPAKPRYIAFENGIYDIDTDEFTAPTPERIITNVIPWNYDASAYSELADRFLNEVSCGDPGIRANLEECIGACMYRNNKAFPWAFILTGEKSNGKSTYLGVVQDLLGEENTAALDLKEMSQRFKSAELFGKLANIGDDIGDEYIRDTSYFKKLVTGERISAEKKGKDPFEFNNYAKLLFSANTIPRMQDKTGAVLRRMDIIPFEATFTKESGKYDPKLQERLRDQEVMGYLINLGIAAIKRVLENKEYTKCEKIEKARAEYDVINDPIIGFLEGDPRIENESTAHVYEDYCGYCIKNGYTALSQIEFGRRLRIKAGYVSKNTKINGDQVRIYTKPED